MKKKYFYWAILLFGVLVSLLPFEALAQLNLDKTGWHIVFEDDFNDPNTLGPNSTKWSNGYVFDKETPMLGGHIHNSTWDNINVHDGVADFITRPLANPLPHPDDEGNPLRYSSGAITAKYDDVASSGCVAGDYGVGSRGFLYGIFEIRCRMPKGKGRLAAFWLYGAGSEVDMFEYDGGDVNNGQYGNNGFSSTIQRIGNDPNSKACSSNSWTVASGDLWSDYHVYTLVWTSTSITFFLDGREIRTVTDPRYIIAGCQFRRMMPCIDAEVGPDPDISDTDYVPYSVDYVRVYKPNNNNYNTPYKSTTAFNTRTQIGTIPPYGLAQDACYKQGGVPTKSMDINPNKQLYYCSGGGSGIMVTAIRNASTGQWESNYLDRTVQNVAGNVVCSPTAPNVFYTDPDGHLWNFYSYNGWHSAPILQSVSDISNNMIISNSGNSIFYRNKSNGLSNFWYDSNGWHNAPIYTANNISSCMGSIAIAGDFVFYKGFDEKLYYVQYNSASGWGNAVLIPSVTNVSNSIIVRPDPNVPGLAGYRIFYIGTDNQVYNAYISNGQWVNYGLNWRVNNAYSDLVLFNDQLYYQSTDGRIFNYYYYESGWRTTPINYNTSPGARGGLCVSNDGVFFTSNYVYCFAPGSSRFTDLPCSTKGAVSNIKGSSPEASSLTTLTQASKRIELEATHVVAYDLVGRILKTVPLPKGQAAITLTQLELAPGFYILRYLTDTEQVVRTQKTVFE